MCGADCWPVSESATKNISASDSSSESPRFFVARKEPSRLSSKILKSLNRFSPPPNSCFSCSLKIGFLPFFMDYAGNVARFSEAFYKCSNEESEGNDQWRFRISLMNFCKRSCHPSCSHACLKPFGKTFSSSFDISSIGVENLVPAGLASHSETSR